MQSFIFKITFFICDNRSELAGSSVVTFNDITRFTGPLFSINPKREQRYVAFLLKDYRNYRQVFDVKLCSYMHPLMCCTYSLSMSYLRALLYVNCCHQHACLFIEHRFANDLICCILWLVQTLDLLVACILILHINLCGDLCSLLPLV